MKYIIILEFRLNVHLNYRITYPSCHLSTHFLLFGGKHISHTKTHNKLPILPNNSCVIEKKITHSIRFCVNFLLFFFFFFFFQSLLLSLLLVTPNTVSCAYENLARFWCYLCRVPLPLLLFCSLRQQTHTHTHTHTEFVIHHG
jgi:hypothetical protein